MIEITTPIAVLTETFARLRTNGIATHHALDKQIQDLYVRPATIENGDEYCAGNTRAITPNRQELYPILKIKARRSACGYRWEVIATIRDRHFAARSRYCGKISECFGILASNKEFLCAIQKEDNIIGVQNRPAERPT